MNTALLGSRSAKGGGVFGTKATIIQPTDHTQHQQP